jgi:serine/threonine-protein kinase
LDGRSDVYALAAMLYEMLTGDPPFQGSTAQAVLARILTEKPTSVTQVRDATPYNVATAVDKALSKLPADRFASASQFVEALKRSDVTPPTGVQASASVDTATPSTERQSPANRAVLAAATMVFIAVAAVVGRMTAPTPEPQVVRATLSFADDPEVVGVGPEQAVAVTGHVTPDGRSVVFVGRTRTGSAAYRRDLSSDEAEAIVGTDGAQELHISPDGTQLVYYSSGSPFVVPMTGGVPRRIEGISFGIHWGHDGYLYGTGGDQTSLVRVSETGGEAELLAQADSGFQYYFPALIPGSDKLLVAHTPPEWTFRALGDAPERSMIRMLDLESGEVTDLIPGVAPYFVPPDILVYGGVTGPTYARIDVESGTMASPAQPFLPRANGFDVSISPAGHLIYVKGAEGGQQVVLVDENGGERSAITEQTAIEMARVSPDGGRILVSQGNPPDLWVYQLSGEAPIRLTFGDGEYGQPAWSKTGEYVYMTSGNGPASDMYRVRSDGLGSPELVRDQDVAVFYPATAPGGDWVVFYELREDTQRDVLALRQDDPEEVIEVVATPANERGPALSPDERFVAYTSNGTGIDEVYVTRFPSGEGRWQVSSGGGWEPVWGDDGRRLYFRGPDGYMIADVDTQSGFRVLRATTSPFGTWCTAARASS